MRALARTSALPHEVDEHRELGLDDCERSNREVSGLRGRERQESPQGILLAPLPQTPAAVPEIPRKVPAAQRHPILWLALSWSQPEKWV